MTALFVATEDDDGVGAGGDVVKEFLGLGNLVCAGAEITSEERRRPALGVR